MKKNTPKRGFLLHAFGHTDLDYGKLAICCALSIKTHLKHNHVTVVMDEGTNLWLKSSIPPKILKKAFDTILIKKDRFRYGRRRHFDSPWVRFKSAFNNQNRVLSYQYSPYDKTILLDVDFLVMNNDFDKIWETREDILMNHKAIDLQGNKFGSIEEQRLSEYGIPMYWATIVYFKRFRKGFYRNDFSYSIAAHIMSGYIKNGVKSLSQDYIVTSYQQDGIVDVINLNEILFLSNNIKKEWSDTLVNMKDTNIHIMNKRELLRISDQYIEMCMEKL